MRISKGLMLGFILGWFCILGIILFFFGNPFGLNLGALNPGTLGDSFGIVNSLVGLATVVLIYKTFQLQKEELEGTRNEFKEQSKVFKMDLFEKGFYNLLDSLEKIIINFQIETDKYKGDNIFVGREGLKILIEKGVTSGGIVKFSNTSGITPDEMALFMEGGSIPSEEISRYLRTLNLLVTSISKKIDDISDRKYYSAIFKGRLSNTELRLIELHINRLTDEKLKKFYKDIFVEIK